MNPAGGVLSDSKGVLQLSVLSVVVVGRSTGSGFDMCVRKGLSWWSHLTD